MPVSRDVQVALDGISDREWSRIFINVTAYGVRLALRLGLAPDSLPTGKSVEDVVRDAVVEIMTGKTRWRPDLKPIGSFLMDMTKAEVLSLRKRSEWKLDIRGLQTEEADSDSVSRVPDPDPSPEEEVEAKELVDRVRGCVADDPEMRQVLRCLEEGMEPAQIADRQGWAREKVYQLIRKIKRRVEASGLSL